MFQSLHNATARVNEHLALSTSQTYKHTLLSSMMDAALAAMSEAALQCLGIGVSPSCCFGYRQANLMAGTAALTLCHALPFTFVAVLCVRGKAEAKSIFAIVSSVAICFYISAVRAGM